MKQLKSIFENFLKTTFQNITIYPEESSISIKQTILLKKMLKF